MIDAILLEISEINHDLDEYFIKYIFKTQNNNKIELIQKKTKKIIIPKFVKEFIPKRITITELEEDTQQYCYIDSDSKSETKKIIEYTKLFNITPIINPSLKNEIFFQEKLKLFYKIDIEKNIFFENKTPTKIGNIIQIELDIECDPFNQEIFLICIMEKKIEYLTRKTHKKEIIFETKNIFTEQQILEKFNQYIKLIRPDFISGFNIKNFDIPLINKKITQYGLVNEIKKQSILLIDSFEISKNNFKTHRYNLDSLAKEYLKDHKKPMDLVAIKQKYQEDPSIVKEYCRRDVQLSLQLLEILDYTNKSIELAESLNLPLLFCFENHIDPILQKIIQTINNPITSAYSENQKESSIFYKREKLLTKRFENGVFEKPIKKDISNEIIDIISKINLEKNYKITDVLTLFFENKKIKKYRKYFLDLILDPLFEKLKLKEASEFKYEFQKKKNNFFQKINQKYNNNQKPIIIFESNLYYNNNSNLLSPKTDSQIKYLYSSKNAILEITDQKELIMYPILIYRTFNCTFFDEQITKIINILKEEELPHLKIKKLIDESLDKLVNNNIPIDQLVFKKLIFKNILKYSLFYQKIYNNLLNMTGKKPTELNWVIVGKKKNLLEKIIITKITPLESIEIDKEYYKEKFLKMINPLLSVLNIVIE